LIVVEALGPYRDKSGAPEQLAEVIKERPILMRIQRKVYPSLEAALDRYCKNNPKILRKSARVLVQRSTEEVLVHGEGEASETGICFKHDPRCVGSSIVSYSEKSVHAFLERISCPVLLIVAMNKERETAKDTKTLRLQKSFEERVRRVKSLQHVVVQNAEHHLHLDCPERFYQDVVQFLSAPLANSIQAKL